MIAQPALSKDDALKVLLECFERNFKVAPDRELILLRVPLRVAPLGAHSDHQGGTVTGLTIDRFVHLLYQPREQRRARVFSVDFNALAEVSFDRVEPAVKGDWGNYLRGAVSACLTAGHKLAAGFDGVLLGEMPIGGLSSSAAVTIAYLQALEQCNALKLEVLDKVKLVRGVENGYLGLRNGILDQSVILSGHSRALTVVDCAREEISHVKLGSAAEEWAILVVYSGLSRSLIGTPFNQRVAECEQAARDLLTLEGVHFSEPALLGRVPRELFDRRRAELSEVSAKRALHFFSEAERVRRGLVAWQAGDVAGFGRLVSESGESSIRNYESGSEALKSLYELLMNAPGVYGARFCGGGFQGCCLALIEPSRCEQITESVYRSYAERHPELKQQCSFHLCRPVNSVSFEVIR